MAHLFIMLAHDPTVQPTGYELTVHLGESATKLYVAFLEDSVALAMRVAHTRVTIMSQPGSTLAQHLQAAHGTEILTLADQQSSTIAQAISPTLASEPIVLLGSNLPHLPIWRLRDTLTHLEGGADVVIGPGERGGWYLIGLRRTHPALLRALPGSDGPPDDLCIAAATHDMRITQIPAWYTIDTLSDVERLATDLRTMPPDVAPATRALLNGAGAQARVVGE
ncbi:MAG: DUF2064 domain-containing protein [Oscillochloris sp.]|nr:DUF2064 domain-containing protein [Oscillochloris sp.]